MDNKRAFSLKEKMIGIGIVILFSFLAPLFEFASFVQIGSNGILAVTFLFGIVSDGLFSDPLVVGIFLLLFSLLAVKIWFIFKPDPSWGFNNIYSFVWLHIAPCVVWIGIGTFILIKTHGVDPTLDLNLDTTARAWTAWVLLEFLPVFWIAYNGLILSVKMTGKILGRYIDIDELLNRDTQQNNGG